MNWRQFIIWNVVRDLKMLTTNVVNFIQIWKINVFSISASSQRLTRFQILTLLWHKTWNRFIGNLKLNKISLKPIKDFFLIEIFYEQKIITFIDKFIFYWLENFWLNIRSNIQNGSNYILLSAIFYSNKYDFFYYLFIWYDFVI